VLPFELFVFATPVSRQARSRKKRSDWREEIRAKALEVQSPNESPWSEPVRVRIGYYFRGDSLDVDNILKAILDGLGGVVYTDDNLIADLIVSKRSLDEFARIDDPSNLPGHWKRVPTLFTFSSIRLGRSR
jgi:Holliday junction resolvase RusA-like endonuclease